MQAEGGATVAETAETPAPAATEEAPAAEAAALPAPAATEGAPAAEAAAQPVEAKVMHPLSCLLHFLAVLRSACPRWAVFCCV